MKLLSTKATSNSHGQDSSYFLGWQEYEKNPYNKVMNPKGIIQICLLILWLDENPDVAGFKSTGKSIFRELALFQDYHGLPTPSSGNLLSSKTTMASLLSRTNWWIFVKMDFLESREAMVVLEESKFHEDGFSGTLESRHVGVLIQP
ncbi:hypothetical protein K1719_040822 [Acacia pycnantha]|nr:hypothetical protein K1719_040822 [Acacia pycnantha]